MKLKPPTIIVLCLSFLIIGIVYFVTRNSGGFNQGVNIESEEFKMIRTHAADAFNAKNYKQAIQLYEQALEMRPENAEVYNDLGAAYYELGLKYAGPKWPSWARPLFGESLEGALAALEEGMKIVESGYIVMETDSAEIATAIEKKAKEKNVAIYPHYAANQTTLNILIGQTKEHFVEARSLFLRALELKSNHAPAYRNLGSYYMKIGKTDKAISYYEEAQELEPRDGELEEYLHQFRTGY